MAVPQHSHNIATTKQKTQSIVQLTILVSWISIGIASLVVWRNFTVDDAFIGWRQGLNLFEHGRYTYNPVGDRVDAATSPAFGLLSALPPLFGLDVVLFFKAVSILIAVALIFVLWRRLSCDGLTRITLIALSVFGPIQAIHLWGGLETYLFFSLALTVCLASMGQLRISRKGFAVLTVLLVFTRLEGTAFVLGAAVCKLISDCNSQDVSRNKLLQSLRNTVHVWISPVLAFGAITALRQAYFGSPFPNTLGTKTLSGGPATVLYRMLSNLSEFSLSALLILIISLLLSTETRIRYLSFVIPTYGLIALVYLPSNLSMNFASRFVFQNYWPLIISGLGLIALTDFKRVVLSAMTFVVLSLNTSSIDARDLIDYYPRMTSAMLDIGESISDSIGGRGTLVIGDAGLAPYASDWFIIDTNFLGTDRTFGTSGVVEAIERADRTVLSLYASSDELVNIANQDRTYQEAARKSGYQLIGAVQWRSNYWFQIWVSPDLLEDKILIRGLERAIEDSVDENGKDRVKDSLISWYWYS